MDAARSLSDQQLRQTFAIGQGSVLATLVHLYAAELVWLAAIEGNPSPMSPFDVRMESLHELEQAWGDLEGRWERFYANLREADLGRPVTKTSALNPTAPPKTTSLADVLLHLSLHAQYTIAQMTNMLRQLGIHPLPDTMLITLSRQQAGKSK